MSEELKGNGHCETLVVDDEPTEGVSGSASEALCARAPLGMLAELTHRCPLQCPYCSNPIELERANKELSDRDVVLGDAPGGRNGRPPGASLGRRAHRADRPGRDRRAAAGSRPLQQSHHRRPSLSIAPVSRTSPNAVSITSRSHSRTSTPRTLSGSALIQAPPRRSSTSRDGSPSLAFP